MRLFTKNDCMIGLKDYPDKFFGLAPSDPNWGIGEHGGKDRSGFVKQANGTKTFLKSLHAKQDWDNKPADGNYGDLLFAKSQNQIIWGANFFDWIVPNTFDPPRRHEFKDFIKEYPTGWIIWDKMNGACNQWDCELAWTSFDRPTIIHEFLWNGMIQGSRENGKRQEGNKKLNEKRIQPCQKPIQLYKWQLINYAQPGQIILDTHVGSGSSLVACEELDFDYVGFENNNFNFQNAEDRIRQYKLQYPINFKQFSPPIQQQ